MLRRLLQIQIPFLLLFCFYGSVWAETIDFENNAEGDFVGDVFGDAGSGPIVVNGENPDLDVNAARIFNSAVPTGNDSDLGTPNNQCPGGGPGNGTDPAVGPGGAFENCTALGNVLIIDASGDPDEPPNDIDETARAGVILEFDFSQIGPVTVEQMTALDIDGNAPKPRVELFNVDDVEVAEFSILNNDPGNGAQTVELGPTSGVVRMKVWLQGSGAIDNIIFNAGEPDIDIEKVTNGNQADGANDADVPEIAVGETVTWRYRVTNTGGVAFTRDEVLVTDEVLAQFNGGLVPEFIREVINNPNIPSDGDDKTLSPDERWIYGAEAPALNLKDPANADATEDGCNPDNVPGEDRPAYFNTGVVNVPGADDSDPSHYCNPPPRIDIEKATNGVDADDPNAGDAPQIAPGDTVTWTYVVTNTGGVPLVNVTVDDNQIGPINACTIATLAPGESKSCNASGVAEDLGNTDFTTVPGNCNGVPEKPLYENKGKATGETATGEVVEDTDPSHYCNPEAPGIKIEKATNGVDADDPNAGDAPQIPAGDTVTWSYVVTNTGTVKLVNVTAFDDTLGVTLNCPKDMLDPDESMICTPIDGMAVQLEFGQSNVVSGTCGNEPDKPLYENVSRVTGESEAEPPVEVEDGDPSHYCNPPPSPECGLTVQKGCEIPPPTPPSVGKCDGKLKEFTVVWNGAGPVDIDPGDGLTGSSQASANTGEAVTFFTDGSTNDTIVNLSGAVSGRSTFHVSCSDDDFNSPDDCGKAAGDGKDKSGFINQWLLEGFVDKNNVELDCTGASGGLGDSSCTFQAVAADCKFPVDKPDILTFRISGGSCDASDNAQKPDKTECTGGSIDAEKAVQVSVNGDPGFTLEPGETFDVERGGDPEIELTQGSVTQFNKFHASCSQPLQAGDRYGANELLLLDGNGLGANVVYSYLVRNGGSDPVTNINVEDDKLGAIGSIGSLEPGDSDALIATAFLTKTTTNTATVDGTGAPGAECLADSNSVTVKVLPPPPCDVEIAFKELKDDAIKWTLSNGAQRKATMDTFTLDFPADFGAIKEVKLDGAIFKAGDSSKYPNGVPSGEEIGPDDWTETDVSKRQLDPGESRTLEVKFTDKDKNASQGDFDLTVNFKEGCKVTF